MKAAPGEVAWISPCTHSITQGRCQTPKFGLGVDKITRPLSCWKQAG